METYKFDRKEMNKCNKIFELLIKYNIDCRRFNNIRMIFLMEDKNGNCNIYT
jgi:predicted secreted protein